MYGWHANKRKQNCLDMDMNVLMMGKQMAHNLGTVCTHKDAIMDEAKEEPGEELRDADSSTDSIVVVDSNECEPQEQGEPAKLMRASHSTVTSVVEIPNQESDTTEHKEENKDIQPLTIRDDDKGDIILDNSQVSFLSSNIYLKSIFSIFLRIYLILSNLVKFYTPEMIF